MLNNYFDNSSSSEEKYLVELFASLVIPWLFGKKYKLLWTNIT